jgi:hypothetical protein
VREEARLAPAAAVASSPQKTHMIATENQCLVRRFATDDGPGQGFKP